LIQMIVSTQSLGTINNDQYNRVQNPAQRNMS